MEVSSRLLALIVELVAIPKEQENKKSRSIFDAVSDSHKITSFDTPGQGTFRMSSRQGKPNFTKYVITKNRVVMSYEFCENSINYFYGLMSDFLEHYSKITGNPAFLAQNILLRRLVNIPGINDSRDYMLKNVYSFKEENLRKFGRPLHLFGSRILFPPFNKDKTTYESKIETSVEDYKTFFIENKGVFPSALDVKKDIDSLKKNIESVDEFINENIIKFITQFM